MRVQSCGLTDLGRSRDLNEDCFAVDDQRQVFLVADGMGGHQHGEVASRIAIETIRDFLAASLDRVDPGETLDPGRPNPLPDGIKLAHRKLREATVQDERLAGMGTTVVALMLDGDRAAIAHVGDSRAYRYRGAQLVQLTQDHTWVREQVVAGFLSEEQARSHPLKNVVTRALGGERDVLVDFRLVSVRAGDVYLLCSDGLTGMLTDGEIEFCLSADESLDEKGRRLVERANARGGLDNITVVLVGIEAA